MLLEHLISLYPLWGTRARYVRHVGHVGHGG